ADHGGAPRGQAPQRHAAHRAGAEDDRVRWGRGLLSHYGKGAMSEKPAFHNLIGGESVPARSGSTFESVNPADRADVVGVFPRSDAADVAAAVEAAERAFPAWRRTPQPARADVLRRAAQLLRDRKEELARLMTREMGKVLVEARGDVQE